jgi:hypothetical protein
MLDHLFYICDSEDGMLRFLPKMLTGQMSPPSAITMRRHCRFPVMAGNCAWLGLSVSYGSVQHHGGTITVSKAPEQGTIFTVSLPFDRGQH